MDAYTAACQTYYTGADGREYHVFTAVTPSIEGRTDPVGYRSELIPAGGTVAFPATVMVEDAVTQDYAAEDFAALLDSWDVSVTAPEGVSRVKLWDAEEETPESPALLYRRLRADPTCTHNEVVWTLRMKSGDVLHLTMTVEFEEQQALRIRRLPVRGMVMAVRSVSVAVQRGQKEAAAGTGAPQWGQIFLSITAPPAARAPSGSAGPGWSWCSAVPRGPHGPAPALRRGAGR